MLCPCKQWATAQAAPFLLHECTGGCRRCTHLLHVHLQLLVPCQGCAAAALLTVQHGNQRLVGHLQLPQPVVLGEVPAAAACCSC